LKGRRKDGSKDAEENVTRFFFFSCLKEYEARLRGKNLMRDKPQIVQILREREKKRIK